MVKKKKKTLRPRFAAREENTADHHTESEDARNAFPPPALGTTHLMADSIHPAASEVVPGAQICGVLLGWEAEESANEARRTFASSATAFCNPEMVVLVIPALLDPSTRLANDEQRKRGAPVPWAAAAAAAAAVTFCAAEEAGG